MPIRTFTQNADQTADYYFTEEAIGACALNIVRHLERNIILHRYNSEKANRLAGMHKYIQVTYLDR